MKGVEAGCRCDGVGWLPRRGLSASQQAAQGPGNSKKFVSPGTLLAGAMGMGRGIHRRMDRLLAAFAEAVGDKEVDDQVQWMVENLAEKQTAQDAFEVMRYF